METLKFKTIKNVSAVSNYHVSLTKKELKNFEADVIKVQKTLNTHEERDLGFGTESLDSISLFMTTIAQSKKKKVETYSGIMFAFGLYLSKTIIAKHGGALMRDTVSGNIDVIVPHGESGAYRMFQPHRIILDIFYGSGEDVNTYLDLFDQVMALKPSEIISELLTNKI